MFLLIGQNDQLLQQQQSTSCIICMFSGKNPATVAIRVDNFALSIKKTPPPRSNKLFLFHARAILVWYLFGVNMYSTFKQIPPHRMLFCFALPFFYASLDAARGLHGMWKCVCECTDKYTFKKNRVLHTAPYCLILLLYCFCSSLSLFLYSTTPQEHNKHVPLSNASCFSYCYKYYYYH